MSTRCGNLTDYGEESERCGGEGGLCNECSVKEAAYWADYFGLSGPEAYP